ncbi:maleate cis-trans isomerase family protein [Variovorax sp. VNK109]|uniref:maleate cis-trans isomerase family protein n=1 Tax=Variovorax sp. VNK109 TaxID=3400919 RepID=UPI003BFF243D
MAIEYGPKGLIGILTPQANTTVEPEFSILLPPGYSTINARLMSDKKTIETRLVDYFARYGEACEQFANAPISALAFACTGASYIAGKDNEARTLDGLSQRHGVPAVTAATAVVDALHEIGARRIALSSPYPQTLTDRSVVYWESHGFEVCDVATAAPDSAQFHPIYSMPASAASATLDTLSSGAGADVDAVVMLGTGMPTLGPILSRAGQSGPPLLSCMLCLVWRCVQAIRPADGDLQTWLSGNEWGPVLAHRMPEMVSRP